MKKYIVFLVLLPLMILTVGCNKKDLTVPVDLENTYWILTKSMYIYENGESVVHSKPWNVSDGFTWHFHKEYNAYSNEYVKIVTEKRQPNFTNISAIWKTTTDSIYLSYMIYMPGPIHSFKILNRTSNSMNLVCEPEETEGTEGNIARVFYTLKRLH